MSNVGRLIRLTRQVKGVKMCELAAAIGRSEAHLQHIEYGTLSGTPETLFAIANHLDISPMVLRDADLQDAVEARSLLWLRSKSVKSIVKQKEQNRASQ